MRRTFLREGNDGRGAVSGDEILWLPIFVALEGEAHAAARRSDAALRAVDEAIAISGETGERWAFAEFFIMTLEGPDRPIWFAL